jgi:hypothetical protein
VQATETAVDLTALDKAVAHLVSGDYKDVIDGMDGVSLALQPVAKALQGQAADRLKTLVQFWVEQTVPSCDRADDEQHADLTTAQSGHSNGSGGNGGLHQRGGAVVVVRLAGFANRQAGAVCFALRYYVGCSAS